MKENDMSWWICLEDIKGNTIDIKGNTIDIKGNTIDIKGNTIDTDEIRQEGGVQVLGGCTEAELNVTYNYGCHFPFPRLNKLLAEDGKKLLQKRYDELDDDVDENDYWHATEGNVKRALRTLMNFADYAIKYKIEAYFRVS